jgi:hypothetical protein
MLLRPSTDDPSTFKIVGNCYVYGIMDGEALLGPLLPPWKGRSELNAQGDNQPTYWNSETKEYSQLDPRLGELPEEWESIK